MVAVEGGGGGLPVVASKVDGITEAVQEGKNGFLIEHNDYEGYSRKILELISDDENRQRIGLQAKEFVRKHYSWQTIAKQYLSIFQETL